MHTSATVLGFEIADPVAKDIDDLDVLDVRDSVPGIAEISHIFMEAFIMLLLDGLQSFYYRRTLLHTLEVFYEHGI
jgi:hypothetical protein